MTPYARCTFFQHYAECPVSKFHVAVVYEGASGALYAGHNIEFVGDAINQSVHGEQCGATVAIQAGESSVKQASEI